MDDEPTKTGAVTPQDTPGRADAKQDRLKAALKANMAKRKAQARARDAGAKTDRS